LGAKDVAGNTDTVPDVVTISSIVVPVIFSVIPVLTLSLFNLLHGYV